jgi:Uri superfamily endonuclease
MIELPAQPGAYALELHLPHETALKVGRLGEALFPSGVLLYLGSAHGPGGLERRLGRHIQADEARPLHWHIDYLRRVARVRALAYQVGQELSPAGPFECLWSQALVRLPGSSVPLPGFGASDCRLGCPAHLVAFPGEGSGGLPLLLRPVWLQALEQVAGASLVISRLLP